VPAAIGAHNHAMSRPRLASLLAPLLAVTVVAGGPAAAAQLAKSYAYFNVGGTTLESLERDLNDKGPKVTTTGMRHPGATEIQFFSRVTYKEGPKSCSVAKAAVTVDARITLPRWTARKGADDRVRFVWDTLSADIKRHEESHALIAKNHARMIEDEVKALSRTRDCGTLEAKVKAVTDRVLARHDAAQAEFDRIEGKTFEDRILRLLHYRMEKLGQPG